MTVRKTKSVMRFKYIVFLKDACSWMLGRKRIHISLRKKKTYFFCVLFSVAGIAAVKPARPAAAATRLATAGPSASTKTGKDIT